MKRAASTAFGMTLTLSTPRQQRMTRLAAAGAHRSGATSARRTVFALLVWLTQMTWHVSASVNCSVLLVKMLLASAKPNSEWSVNTAFRPSVRACSTASLAKALRRCQRGLSERVSRHVTAAPRA